MRLLFVTLRLAPLPVLGDPPVSLVPVIAQSATAKERQRPHAADKQG